MVTKFILFLTFCSSYFLLSCKKNNRTCIRYEYLNTTIKYDVLNELDSYPVNTTIKFRFKMPKKYLDENYNKWVAYDNNTIGSNIGIAKLDTIQGASIFDLVNFTIEKGSIFKDSINYTPHQLGFMRTFYAIPNINNDSLELLFSIRVPFKGKFYFKPTLFAGYSADCTLHTYIIRPSVHNQHLEYLAERANGYVDNNSQVYSYCFKVY